MVIIPREKPVIQNLNSYYLHVGRLFEHYQGELGTGGVHFKSNLAEGMVFFDENNLLSGIFQDDTDEITGMEAIDRIKEASSRDNFVVAVYKVPPEKVYFWASLPNAEDVYKGLSSEFTDLEGLIKKMSSEKLTGYIDVALNRQGESGIIFFNMGEIIGSSCSWEKGKVVGLKENQDLLVVKSRESGGIFNVRKISLRKEQVSSAPAASEQEKEPPFNALDMIQGLLVILENSIRSNKKIKADFDTILKRKFVEKAYDYDFLDPFAAEFQYVKGKVIFTGNADHRRLVQGVIDSTMELADEHGIKDKLLDELTNWRKKYSKEIMRFGFEL